MVLIMMAMGSPTFPMMLVVKASQMSARAACLILQTWTVPDPLDLDDDDSDPSLVNRSSRGGIYLGKEAVASGLLNDNYLGNINISGLAYPEGEISLLKNNQVVAITTASKTGTFDLSHDYDGQFGYELVFIGTTTDGSLATPISLPLSIKLTVPAINTCGECSVVAPEASPRAISYTFPSMMHLTFSLAIATLILLLITWLLICMVCQKVWL